MECFSGSDATPRLTVVVGGAGEDTRLETNQAELLVTARAGETGQGWHGGDSYSGGAVPCCWAMDNPGGEDGGTVVVIATAGETARVLTSPACLSHISLSLPGPGVTTALEGEAGGSCQQPGTAG